MERENGKADKEYEEEEDGTREGMKQGKEAKMGKGRREKRQEMGKKTRMEG